MVIALVIDMIGARRSLSPGKMCQGSLKLSPLLGTFGGQKGRYHLRWLLKTLLGNCGSFLLLRNLFEQQFADFTFTSITTPFH